MTLSIDRKLPNLAQRHIYSNSLYFTFICVATQPHQYSLANILRFLGDKTKDTRLNTMGFLYQQMGKSQTWHFFFVKPQNALAQKLGSGVCKVKNNNFSHGS